MKRFICGCTILAFLIISGILFYKSTGIKDDSGVELSFSEPYFTVDDLVQYSDMVVSGKITKFKEKKSEIIESTNPEVASLKNEYNIYELKIDETYYGDEKK